MHFIDGITLATGLLGCLYGAIAGPFVTVFSILGIICAGPVLYLLYPYFFSYIPQYQNDLIAHLVFFPIGYLILIFSFKALAIKLDSLTKKFWPGGKRFWGGLIGSLLGSLCWMSIIALSYPFVKELTEYSFSESKIWWFMESYCAQRPESYIKLCELVSVNEFKRAMKQSSSISGNKVPEISKTETLLPAGKIESSDHYEDEMDKIFAEQEHSALKQKMLYEFLQKYLSEYMKSVPGSNNSST